MDETEVDQQLESFVAFVEKFLSPNIRITKQQKGVVVSVLIPFKSGPVKKQVVKPAVSIEGTQVAIAINKMIRAANPTISFAAKDDAGADYMDKLLKKYDRDFIGQVAMFVYDNKEDLFWKTRILSVKNFHRKFETIAAQYSGQPKRKGWA
jgi:hypothetical protein